MKKVFLFIGLITLIACAKEQQPGIDVKNDPGTEQNSGNIDTLSGIYHIAGVSIYNFPTPQPNDTTHNYTAYITYTSQDSTLSAIILNANADTVDLLESITAYQTIDSANYYEIRYSEGMCSHGELRYYPQNDSISWAFRINACSWGMSRYYYGAK